MISQILIQNFGLIDKLTVFPKKGLTVFTGETGAGKSILIDALTCSLGKRISASQIRDPKKPCIIETVFELNKSFFKTLPSLSEYLEEDILIFRRVFSSDGKTKNTINGFTVTASQLKEIGNHLIDIHGPHDHQMLFSETSHIEILDRLSALGPLKNIYNETYHIFSNHKNKLDELSRIKQDRDREMDIILHQKKELEQVPLDNKSYEEFLQKSRLAGNSETLHEYASELYDTLQNEEAGTEKTINNAFSLTGKLNDIDSESAAFSEALENMQETLSDLISNVRKYIEKLSFDPDEINEINKTHDIYYELLRKYGPAINNVQDFYTGIIEKYDTLSNIEHNTLEITKKMKQIGSRLRETADQITSIRKKTALKLKDTIEKELKELGIKHVQFECRIENQDPSPSGQDKVTFFISPNKGEALKPMAEIVSSGEAARVMLALKKALTIVDPIPILIFDEIDAQIGGRLGNIIGKKLKELSENRQVLLITHLPQIASFADCHMKVLKNLKNSRTSTEVILLNDADRTKELAKMMSGEKESSIAIDHAKAMLKNAGYVPTE